MVPSAEPPRTIQPIALDAMGGDLGVQPLIEGALQAVLEDGAVVVVVGTPEARACLDACNRSKTHGDRAHQAREQGRLQFVDAVDVVTMDDKPAAAVRLKKQSSMRIACDLVESGKAAVVVSVGNSGAMMANASFVFGRLPRVVRPAIGTVLPSFAPRKRTLLVDAGANSVCEALHLAQFGVLGSVYLEHAFGQQSPAVAVLSNGEEEHKGTPLTREALALLKRTDLHVVGFCEGRDLNEGRVHVVVTDGFTGNVVLKAAEGVFSFMGRVIKETFEQGSIVDKLGGLLSKPGWARIKEELDPREFGAAPLLGLRRPAFIAHGKSDAHAVRSAIRAARRFVDHDVTAHMATAIERNAAVWATTTSA
ncbi:MAG: phosphate acyltransferase PlsX [Deltaproteobacteria bacterium]|nr:phosphate acyltransferase PlsX [Deltaproteobacteria bacterium]